MKIRPLTKDLQEKAEKELNEIPSEIEENLKSIRNWLEKQEHIQYKDDDQLLVNFLRASKYSLQRTKDKLDAYYTFKTLAPDIAQACDPLQSDVQASLKLGLYIPLPIPEDDPTSPRVFLMHCRGYDPDEVTMSTLLKSGTLVHHIFFNEDDNFVVSGSKVIWDMKGMHFKTALQATPDIIKKSVYCYEKAYPNRINGIHMINVPKFMEAVLNMTKLLFSKKMAERIHFYSTDNLEQIYKDIPKSILPTEYGGDAGSIENLAAKWKETVENHRESLLSEKKYHTDESKRPGKPNIHEGLFGIDGSFRKLTID